MQENTAKRKKKGYRILLNAHILTVKVFTTDVRVEDRNIRNINFVLFHSH